MWGKCRPGLQGELDLALLFLGHTFLRCPPLNLRCPGGVGFGVSLLTALSVALTQVSSLLLLGLSGLSASGCLGEWSSPCRPDLQHKINEGTHTPGGWGCARSRAPAPFGCHLSSSAVYLVPHQDGSGPCQQLPVAPSLVRREKKRWPGGFAGADPATPSFPEGSWGAVTSWPPCLALTQQAAQTLQSSMKGRWETP